MSYPLIILGAGASHDYIHPHSKAILYDGFRDYFKPPLTNGLLDASFFDKIIKSFPEIEPLSANIATSLRNRKISLETFLSEIKEKSSKSEYIQKQLIAFEFYLQRLFQEISDKYGKQTANNYNALIHEIKTNNGKACIVSFNYDLLFEQCLSEINDDIDSYINGPIKLIKIHGSCDWVYSIDFGIYARDEDVQDLYQFLMKNPWHLTLPEVKRGEILKGKEYVRIYKDRKFYFYPALAIPLPGKDSFICPKHHIDELKKALSRIDKILIIGWQAGDPYLIKIMEENIKKPISVAIVSGNSESIREIKIKLSSIKDISFGAEYVGFSDFMGSINCKNFFS